MCKEIKKLHGFRSCSAYIEIKKTEPNPHTAIPSLTHSYFFLVCANNLLCLMMG